MTPIARLLAAVEAGEMPRPLPFSVSNSSLAIHAFSGSIDAAISLCEAMLPGWLWVICPTAASVHPDRDRKGFTSGLVDNTPARALLIAVLRALVAKEARG